MPNIIQVRSTHGSLIINEKGYIQSLHIDTNDIDSAVHLDRIIRFDMYEWMLYWKTTELPASIDILDLGYWYRDPHDHPTYIQADDKWRKEIARDLLGRK